MGSVLETSEGEGVLMQPGAMAKRHFETMNGERGPGPSSVLILPQGRNRTGYENLSSGPNEFGRRVWKLVSSLAKPRLIFP